MSSSLEELEAAVKETPVVNLELVAKAQTLHNEFNYILTGSVDDFQKSQESELTLRVPDKKNDIEKSTLSKCKRESPSEKSHSYNYKLSLTFREVKDFKQVMQVWESRLPTLCKKNIHFVANTLQITQTQSNSSVAPASQQEKKGNSNASEESCELTQPLEEPAAKGPSSSRG